MSNYYRDVLGNLNMGDIAKSSDIHHIQRHIKDALKTLLADLHDGESYILGTDNVYKNSFNLVAAPKEEGRYIDSSFTFDEETDFLNINYFDVKQPIVKTKTSLYSIVTKFRNTSNKDIPITCELQDENGDVLRSNTITLLANTPSANYEVVFDLDFYPTPPNLSFQDIIKRDGKDIPPKTKEKGFESYDEGYDESHEDEKDEKPYFSAGVSKLYFVIKRSNLNAVSLTDSSKTNVVFDPNTSLGVYCKEQSLFPDKDFFAETNGGGTNDTFQLTKKNIFYKDIYANEMTYICSGGNAIIRGEKVECLDTHISVEGGNKKGNVLTQIYLGEDGHLYSSNKKASLTTDILSFEDDIDDPLPIEYLPIALILTYSNYQYEISKEPLIIQDLYDQKPRSHHERLRRLEKQMDWSNDIALPSRIKYTISDGEWVDEHGEALVNIPHTKANKDNTKKNNDGENLSEKARFVTTDENGNLVVKLNEAVTQTIPVTLKEDLKDSNGEDITLEETDVLNISSFGKIEHMVHDSKKGTLKLENEKTKNDNAVATTKEEAKLTEYNPWDDSARNRPSDNKYKKIEREYTVVSGKNGAHDKKSSYPGMTFYTNTKCKFKKLTIPIHKFKNCSSVKFYIWKRQDKNNKKNKVPNFKKKQLIYTSNDFSLKKAKTKDKHQYMDEGFTLDFKKKGLTLEKGQYVIVAVPKPKSGSGSLFVETYKPKNSKDFCIRYKGAANASHFSYDEAYQEIWYNSASAIVEEESFYKKGSVESKTLKWTDQGLEKIESVKPIIDKNLTLGNKSKDSYQLYVKTGGDWIKVTPNKENVINDGGATTFQWKLEFKGDGKSTPELKYNSKTKYAIKFVLTRAKPGDGMNFQKSEDYEKNMCLTSIPFDGDNILRKYVGDMNLALTNSRFEGYEFARLWAEEISNENLLIDIQASDRNFQYLDTKDTVDLWSLHYCDLTLEDFEKISVDYNDYDAELEFDENNMRLKLDSEHSYNDDDIQIPALRDFTKEKNDIDGTDNDLPKFVNKDQNTVGTNQVFLKKVFENPIDLTKYTGLKFKFKVEGDASTSMILNGLGIYLSSTEQKEVPSNIKNLPLALHDGEPLQDTDTIPPIIDPDESSASYYEGEIIQINHVINPDSDGDKICKPGFYEYVKVFDEEKNKYVYKLQQIHDLRTYSIYEIGDIKYFDDDNTFEVRIEIDQDSNNMKNVKEIGILTLNDEGKYEVTDNTIKTKMSATCEESGDILLTLTDKDNNSLGKEVITWGENDSSKDTTSAAGGQITVTGLAGKEGEIEFVKGHKI